MARWAGLIAVALAALALEAGVRGQTRSPSAQAPVFRAGTNLALVRFQVIRDSRYIGGLTAADIRLLENGTERPVDLFEGGCGATRTRPIDIAIPHVRTRSHNPKVAGSNPAPATIRATGFSPMALAMYGARI
jgi:hypothetical protein